jgi:HlyD family secretion protein
MMQHLTTALLLGATMTCAGCGGEERASYQGYVEGEYLYLAAPAAGYLQTLDRLRGSRVAAGEPLFAIVPEPDVDALAEAEARAASAAARVTNLRAPRREPEIAALEAELRAEEANLRLARTRLRQQEALARENFVSQARVDEARSDHDQAMARTEAVRQQLASYRATLGREAEVRAAEAEQAAANAAAAQRRWVVERMAVAAPAAGEISDTYYRPGEWVAAGAPVASLLPDARRRLRFYVPETALAKLRPGQAVEARCDGCAGPIRATIDFIAPQAEYTPPVIYSRGSREKLVFRVEAAPAPEQAATLRPGLPVDVRVLGPR